MFVVADENTDGLPGERCESDKVGSPRLLLLVKEGDLFFDEHHVTRSVKPKGVIIEA